MKKKSMAVTVLISTCLLILISYLFFAQADAELDHNITQEIQQEDFTLHIRVERIDDGFEVFKSIQYTGEESVEIKHQTPLVSVSFKNQNHDYTGSTVTKSLKTGHTYHPQDSITFDAPEEGVYTLFCEANFMVDNEQIKINHQEELLFN